MHIIRILIISILLTGSVSAGENGNETLPDKEEIWAAIEALDFAAAEASFANAHLRAQDGTGDPDGTRWLFEIFGTNSPQIVDFTAQWLKTYPESPYANIAQAWINHRTGWYIRGDGMARDIFPGALSEFSELHEIAWQHAEKAYEADNSLRPASDALLRLANSTGRKRQALKVLHSVMGSDPNMGTLIRAIDMTIPGWGGSWKMAENLCGRYAGKIDWSQGDPVTYCKLYAFGNYHVHDDGLAWFKREVMSGKYPDHANLLMPWATHHTATRAEVEFARRFLNRDDVTYVDHARDFDTNIAPMYDFNFVSPAHTKRAWDHAREAIKRDPYDLYLIETLQSGVKDVRRTETGIRWSQSEKLTREEEIEFARRKLVAAPYRSRNWNDYARWRFPLSPENLFLDEPYRVNAIYFDNHSVGSLFGYAFEKWHLLSNLERLESDLKSERFLSASAEVQARTRAEYAKWLAARERMDMDRDLKCPMMRAYRLYKFVCAASAGKQCADENPQMIEMLDLVEAEVNRRRVCQGVMAVDELELFYSPVDVDLSVPEG